MGGVPGMAQASSKVAEGMSQKQRDEAVERAQRWAAAASGQTVPAAAAPRGGSALPGTPKPQQSKKK